MCLEHNLVFNPSVCLNTASRVQTHIVCLVVFGLCLVVFGLCLVVFGLCLVAFGLCLVVFGCVLLCLVRRGHGGQLNTAKHN